jgi:hypothetical protein
VKNGEILTMPSQKAIPETISKPLSPDEQRQRMQKMRDELDI